MNKIFPLLLLVSWLFVASPVQGEDEIVFTAEQITNLGLSVAPLQKAEKRPLFSAPAMVKVPLDREIVVNDPNGGVVKQIFVSEGETVSLGQKLIEIISSALLGLQKDVLIAQSRYQLALRQFNREKSLFEKGVIAEKRLQEAEMQFQQARISRDEARQVLSIAGFSKSELETLVRTENLKNSRLITAPLAGVVLHKFVVIGQRVEDHDPLFSIADLSTLWLEAAAPLEHIAEIHIGDGVEILGIAVTGRIQLVDTKVDEKHQSVLVRAVVENPQARIRPGQSVQVTMHRLAGRDDLYTTPKSSLILHQGKTLVFLRSKNGFVPRFVETLGESDDQVIIQGDIRPDDRVAVQGTVAIKAHWLGFGGGE
ncbi:MAG: efflux RND transporter periplasmic adaptor subunit [Methylococcales bacterium]